MSTAIVNLIGENGHEVELEVEFYYVPEEPETGSRSEFIIERVWKDSVEIPQWWLTEAIKEVIENEIKKGE